MLRRVVGLAGLLVLPALPAPAATLPDRVVSMSYSMPAGYTTGTGATLFGDPTVTGTSQPDEDRVTVSSEDADGQVALVVDITTKDGTTTRTVTCNGLIATMSPGTTVAATPVTGRCNDGHISIPRGGEVTLAFHKHPRPPQPRRRITPTASPELRWAVLVGIQDYAGRTHSTVGARGDVAAIRSALLASGWRNDHIMVLTDRQATAQGIRYAFDWLAARSTSHTFSLFHYSGHVCIASRGPCASGHTYLWSQDNHFLRESEVWSRMSKVRGYSWLDIAGCEAGAFDYHSPSRLFTASSKGSETSYENPDWHQSYWTGLAWARGFSKGLADDKHQAYRATIYEMASYGKRLAPRMTESGERGPQHPVVKGGSRSWTLYRPPGG